MKNDTETLVKDFLELWQKQFAHMSREGDFLGKGLEGFAKMQADYTNSMDKNTGTKHAQPATASDIFRNIGNEFIKLAGSYRELEERIAKLESGVKIARPAPAKKTGEKKSGGSKARTTKTNK